MNLWLLWVAVDWLFIFGAFFILPMAGWAGWIAAAFVIATRQHAIAILGHDGAHKLAIPGNIPMNNFLTQVLCFWPTGVDLASYRDFHWAHHRHVGSRDDPEIKLKELAHGNAMPDRLMKFKLIVCDLIGLGIPEATAGLMIINGNRPSSFICPAVWHVIAFIVLGWQFTALWFSSLVTIQWAVFRYRVWCEHQGLDGGTWPSKSRPFDFLFRPHNTGWHLEHHDDPTVPFYKLPSLVRSDR